MTYLNTEQYPRPGGTDSQHADFVDALRDYQQYKAEWRRDNPGEF